MKPEEHEYYGHKYKGIEFQELKSCKVHMYLSLFFCAWAGILFVTTASNNYFVPSAILIVAIIYAMFYIGDVFLDIYNHWRFFYAEKED